MQIFREGVWPVGIIYEAEPEGKQMVQCQQSGKWRLRDIPQWTVTDRIIKDDRAIITITGPAALPVVGHNMIIEDDDVDESVEVLATAKIAESGRYKVTINTLKEYMPWAGMRRCALTSTRISCAQTPTRQRGVGSFVIIPSVVPDEEDEYKGEDDQDVDDDKEYDEAVDKEELEVDDDDEVVERVRYIDPKKHMAYG